MPASPDLPATHFPGSDRFYALLDAAVALGEPEATTDALRAALESLIRDPSVHLPDAVRTPVAGHYARRELYRSPVHGYSVVAMTWGPGQDTPLTTTTAAGAWKACGRASWTSSATNCWKPTARARASAPPRPCVPAPAARAA